jgi:hypothetical protein
MLKPLLLPASRTPPRPTLPACSGTARIMLKPLVPVVPGFGAAVVSLRAPPIVRFNLNFGKSLGGGYSAGAIKVCTVVCAEFWCGCVLAGGLL